jgi:deoxycytidine triphosphate deaminase
MGILNRDEIERRLKMGGLLRYARINTDGQFDLEPASYDLTAGKAVWREPSRKDEKGSVQTQSYKRDEPLEKQPTVTVQPGQMIFVITREEVCMPTTLSGTVYSMNSLAREGILALNAGHVDPGYEGPIVIRLINLRATPWTLTLGTPIFTIVFQTLDFEETDHLLAHDAISADETLVRVRASADAALSNALFDLYALEMQERLNEHYTSVETRLRTALTGDFLKRDEFGQALWKWFWRAMTRTVGAIAVLILLGAAIATIVVGWDGVLKFFRELFSMQGLIKP